MVELMRFGLSIVTTPCLWLADQLAPPGPRLLSLWTDGTD